MKAAVQLAGKRKPYCQSNKHFISAHWVGSCCSTSSKSGVICTENLNNVRRDHLHHMYPPAWSFCLCCCLSESKHPASSKDTQSQENLDDLTVLKSLADGQKSKEATEVPLKKDDQYVPDESDSTKSRRLAEDYDSTKNGMDYGKYRGTSLPLPSMCWGQASRCMLLSVTGSPPGRHFKKELAEITRACDGDKQRQIERVKD